MAITYDELKAQYPNALLLFQFGDRFTAYDDDAEILATVCDTPIQRNEAGRKFSAQQKVVFSANLAFA